MTADVIGTARRIADETLFPAAMAVEAADAVPVEVLDVLAEAGLYGISGPVSVGGMDLDPLVQGSVIEILAGGSLATAFIWAQHHSLVRNLVDFAPSPLREEWLPPLCRGELRSGLALAGVLPGPPQLRADRVPGGWRIDGSSPWVTGWSRVDVVLAAARTQFGGIAWLIVDAADRPGLAAERQRLVAVDSSVTVRLDFDGLEVPEDRLIRVGPHDVAGYGTTNLRNQGSLALGVAGRCCSLLGPTALDDEVVACRTALGKCEPEDMPVARAWASELCVRAATTLVVSAGSRSILLGEHPQRLAREALFLLVFGSRPGIRASLLERIITPPLITNGA
jgi:alkylation response protein AidB-like acyl-CoA dehydrogenase